jgi:hypothetical protein
MLLMAMMEEVVEECADVSCESPKIPIGLDRAHHIFAEAIDGMSAASNEAYGPKCRSRQVKRTLRVAISSAVDGGCSHACDYRCCLEDPGRR